ncbi:SpoIIE family protein phosphatase [Synechococcus sp. BA-120 BA3]|nr:SpoIIE family protein phosphatase [Synechococcus sp. BA-120 BA3]
MCVEPPPSLAPSTTSALPFQDIPLFRDVKEEVLLAAVHRCQVLPLQPGQVLLTPGQTNEDIFIILAGTVTVHLGADNYRSKGITIPIGHCIGEFSAIDGRPASALVRAEDGATVLRIPQQVFWSHMVLLPGVARNMMISLVERTRLTNQLTLEAQREALELSHLRKELDLARDLQLNMLPPQGDLFSGHPDIEIATLMEPATTVAGDFFDAFFVDGQRLFVCIGDVSGHGLGAALFMARSVGLLRILANTETAPDAVLRRLNDSLAEGNEAALFVTMFCGYLDLSSGLFTYSNGGHCPPLLQRDGEIRPIPMPRGALLGVFPGRPYQSLTLTLDPGDLLMVYTDGVTEAENTDGEPFGVQGCRSLLAEAGQGPLDALIQELRQSLRGFTSSQHLEDDCTLLLLRRRPGPGLREGS